MNGKAYELANRINMDVETENIDKIERLSAMEAKKYQTAFLNKIGEENSKMKKRKTWKHPKMTAAAACAAAVLLGTAAFGEEAHAAMEHIRWSISSALGLSGSLENYREVVNTAVSDKGYVITLQEVVATEDKLVVNYTVEQESGQSLGEIPSVPDGSLYINGKAVLGGASGGAGFLDEGHTRLGVDMAYDVFGADMSKESTYQLKFRSLGSQIGVEGKWDFEFTASGADLIADTKRLPIQKEFAVADGVTVTLEELSLNELEQRISYRMEGASDYILMLMAEDAAGHQAQFETKTFSGESGSGYMQNQEILHDGRIDETTDSVKLTLYAVELPEESGRLRDDYRQIGEAFELKIN